MEFLVTATATFMFKVEEAESKDAAIEIAQQLFDVGDPNPPADIVDRFDWQAEEIGTEKG